LDDCRLAIGRFPIADCGLPIGDCRLPISPEHLIGNRQSQIDPLFDFFTRLLE